MLKKLIARGIEKVAAIFGFDAGKLREDLAATCEQVVRDNRYLLRLRVDNGNISARSLVDGNNQEVDIPDNFDAMIKSLLEKHINRKLYRLVVAFKDGEFDTIRIHSEATSKATIDFGSDEVNRSYGRFREAFYQLQEGVWDDLSSGVDNDVVILSNHLERIEESIEEIEAVVG